LRLYGRARQRAASNIQIIGNSCERLGEVALYAEFRSGRDHRKQSRRYGRERDLGHEFQRGRPSAVVQGNLIRNLVRREQEPDDKRGEGIAVEADAVVSGKRSKTRRPLAFRSAGARTCAMSP
jgi:putative cofactor-binding repeat protein